MNSLHTDSHKSLPVYEVHSYSLQRLKQLLSQESVASASFVNSKSHVAYFESYFKEIGAMTVVVERDYVDRDYLEDFSNYYVKCFRHYKKKCTRLHFFGTKFSRAGFTGILKGRNCKLLNKLCSSYLGFIVLKPLPRTIIGRTCLAVYGEDSGRRKYFALTEYGVSLFGIDLCVKSLAFQEQDHVVAACATSALWSTFQATGRLFLHPVLSPFRITKIASRHAHEETRYFPNAGLTASQVAGAIREMGLDPLKVAATDSTVFKSTVFGYATAGIPLLMGGRLVRLQKNKYVEFGWHAVAVAGYSLGAKEVVSNGGDILERSSSMDKIYAHDDQVGPFARMTILEQQNFVKIYPSDVKRKLLLSTSFGEPRSEQSFFVPEFFIIPLYNKIRISLDVVLKVARSIGLLTEYASSALNIYKEKILWETYLTAVNTAKKDILSCSTNRHLAFDTISRPMAKYLWVLKAYCEEECLAEFYFDATDIQQSSFLCAAIVYENSFYELMSTLSACIADASARVVLDWFSNEEC